MLEDLDRRWEQSKGIQLERLKVVEAASEAALRRSLDGGLRRDAERAAHNLASLGTFYFAAASDVAQRVESILEAEAPLGAHEAVRLSKLVADLRRAVDDAANSKPSDAHRAQNR